MIRIENVYKRLGTEWVLRGIDLEVQSGQIMAIVGPSGAGKSVLLRHVIGLLVPDWGDVLIDGRSIASARYSELPGLRRQMGYVFQSSALLDSLTIRQNLRLAMDDRESERDPQLTARRIGETLDLVNLDEDVLDMLPGDLSGGMRKRVGVARAVIREPSIILYDEPSTGLDPHNASLIYDIITRARTRLGATSIIVTHDVASLPGLADGVALLDEGRIAFLSTPADFLSASDARVRAFLGPVANGAGG